MPLVRVLDTSEVGAKHISHRVGARTIVEFGTSFGLSTLHLAAALRDNGGGHLITSEFEPSKVARARHNLTAGGFTDLVEIREGDALQTLSVHLPDRIDLVLLDGAKALYPEILSLVESRLRPGAFLVADNADDSPDYLGARANAREWLHVDAICPGCGAVHADPLKATNQPSQCNCSILVVGATSRTIAFPAVHVQTTGLGLTAEAFSSKGIFQLEKSGAKQTGAVKHRCCAPHDDKKLKHEGHRTIRLIPIDSKAQPLPQSKSDNLKPQCRGQGGSVPEVPGMAENPALALPPEANVLENL